MDSKKRVPMVCKFNYTYHYRHVKTFFQFRLSITGYYSISKAIYRKLKNIRGIFIFTHATKFT